MPQKQSFVGLDIADHTIEVLEITGSTNKPVFGAKNNIGLEPGIIEWGRIKDGEKLSAVFNQLFLVGKAKEINRENVVVSLPDSLVYVHIFHLPPHSKREREKLILKELQGIVPEKLSNILYSYQVFFESKEVVKGMIVAIPKDAAEDWFKFFEKNKIKIKFFDVEPIALRRAIFFNKKNEKICLIDLGAQSTSINILNKERFYFSYNTHIAGDYFTREISNKFSINLADAENKKITNGLTGTDEEVSSLIKKGLDKLIIDIKNIIAVNDDQEQQISKIILVGGTSKMNGLVEYLQKEFTFPIEFASFDKSIKVEDISFIESFGLALRAFSSKDYEDEPTINEKDVVHKNKAFQNLKKEESNYLRDLDEHFDVSGVSPEVNFDRYNPDTKKVSRTFWLLIFLAFSVILLVGAFFYRSINRNSPKPQETISQNNQNVVQYELQDVSVKLPVAISASAYAKDRVSGRVFTHTILKLDLLNNESAEDVMEISRQEASSQISNSEELYFEPLSIIDNNEEYDYRWLILSST
ncbi:MAG: hypothetical protein ACD_18C00266G0001, partial [uncultured bacterium]